MKKVMVLATAALLFSGVSFAHKGKKTKKEATKKECCSKGKAYCDKDKKQKTTAKN